MKGAPGCSRLRVTVEGGMVPNVGPVNSRVSAMPRIWITIALLLLPAMAYAEWTLRQTDDGHWITTRTEEGHQLIVAHNRAEETHFLLVLEVDEPAPPLPSRVVLAIDRGPVAEAGLALLERRPTSRLFRIEMNREQKKS